MMPPRALVRYHWRLLGGKMLPAIAAIAAGLVLVTPSELSINLAILGFSAALFVPWSCFAEPTTNERCLPLSWVQLRRARAIAHLAIVPAALLPLAAFAVRWPVEAGDDLIDRWSLIAIACAIPLWPLLATAAAPLCWRHRWWSAPVIGLAGCAMLALTAWFALSAAHSPTALVLPACVGALALVLIAPACALGAAGDSSAAASGMGSPAAPRASIRLWSALASPLAALPPQLRALAVGLWLRPWYLFLLVLMPGFYGVIARGVPDYPVFAAIILAAFLRVERLSEATIGGLLSRRAGLLALVVPPLILFVGCYLASLPIHPPRTEPLTLAPTATVPPDAKWRTTELTLLEAALPHGQRLELPDGTTLTVQELLERRIAAQAPALSTDDVAKWVAQTIERDQHLRIDPHRLVAPGPTGTLVSTTPVLAEVDAAMMRQALVSLVAALALAAGVMAMAIGGRRTHSHPHSARFQRLVSWCLAAAVVAVVAWLVRSWTATVPVSSDLALPPVAIGWWDLVVVQAVAHAGAVCAALGFVGAALFAIAIVRARWLPLVHERRIPRHLG